MELAELFDYKIIHEHELKRWIEAGTIESKLTDYGVAGWDAVGVISGVLLLKRTILLAEDMRQADIPASGALEDCRGCCYFHEQGTNQETGVVYGWCDKLNTQTACRCSEYRIDPESGNPSPKSGRDLSDGISEGG